MAVIAVKPYVLRDAVLDIKIGAAVADSYQGHCSRVAIVPSTTVIRWRGMAPTAKYASQTDPDWSLELAYAQDEETVNSLHKYLLANVGKEADVTFRPRGTGTAGRTVKVILSPGTIGGDVDGVPTAQVSMGVIGVPTDVV